MFWCLDESDNGTTHCILLGYLFQYFYLSFFFWSNVMGFNVWQTLGCYQKGRFLWGALYAQGVPLLICILTAVVDSFRPQFAWDNQLHPDPQPHYHNMGSFRCFLGDPVRGSFPTSSTFLYFHLYILLLQIANFYFLGNLFRTIYKGWENASTFYSNFLFVMINAFVSHGVLTDYCCDIQFYNVFK